MPKTDELLMEQLQKMPWMAAERLPTVMQPFFVASTEAKLDAPQPYRLFFYNHRLMEGSDTSVFEAQSRGEDPMCLYMDYYKVFKRRDDWILDVLIAPLSTFTILIDPLKPGCFTCKPPVYNHMTPSIEGSAVLAVVKCSITLTKESDRWMGILCRGTHPSLRQCGVMKILSINILQAIYDIYGELLVTNDSAHIATALYFATTQAERDLVRTYAVDEKGNFIIGAFQNEKPLTELIRYHKKKLGLHMIPLPVSALAALSVTATLPPRKKDDDKPAPALASVTPT